MTGDEFSEPIIYCTKRKVLVFSKGHELYGLYEARQALRQMLWKSELSEREDLYHVKS